MKKKLVLVLIAFICLNLFLGVFIFNNTTNTVNTPLNSKKIYFTDNLSSSSGYYLCYKGKEGIYGNIKFEKNYRYEEKVLSSFLGEKGEVNAFRTPSKLHVYRLGYKKASINLSNEFNLLGITTIEKISHGGVVYQPKKIALYKNKTVHYLDMEGESLSTEDVEINQLNYSLQGERVVFRNKSILKVFSLKENNFLGSINVRNISVKSLKFSRNGYYLGILGQNNSLNCYVLPYSDNISQLWKKKFDQEIMNFSISDTAKNTLVNTKGPIYLLNRAGEVDRVFDDGSTSFIYAKNDKFFLGQDNLLKIYRNGRPAPLAVYDGNGFFSIIKAEESRLSVLKKSNDVKKLLTFSSKESILSGNRLLWSVLLTSIIIEITFFYLIQKKGIGSLLNNEIKYFFLGGSIGFLFYLLIYEFEIEGLISFISAGLVSYFYLSNLNSSYFKAINELIDMFFDVIIVFVFTTLVSPLIGFYLWAIDNRLVYNLLSRMFFEFVKGSINALLFSIFGALISFPVGFYLLRKNK